MQVKILKSKNIKLKHFIILSTIFWFCISCTIKEKPVFLNVENIKIIESNSKQITITANALFLNPNDIGGKLKTDGIKIFINDNEMTTISTKNFEVPAKKKFSIPLKADIPTDSVFNNKNIGRLIGSLFNKQIKVQYTGGIIYRTLGFSYTYNIDKTDFIKIKL